MSAASSSRGTTASIDSCSSRRKRGSSEAIPHSWFESRPRAVKFADETIAANATPSRENR